MNTEQTKRCSRCGASKSPLEFGANRSTKDGLAHWCKACTREANRERTAANPEANRARAKAWRDAHPERARARAQQYYLDNKESHIERAAAWAKNNPDRRRAVSRKWKIVHRDAVAQSARQARAKRPHVYLAHVHRARARRAGVSGAFTAQEWLAVCEQHGNRCAACGAQRRLTIDHIIPIAQGGSNDISNIQPLCAACNRKKSNKTIDYRARS